MSATPLSPKPHVGWWRPEAGRPENDTRTFHDALRKPTEPIYVIEKNGLPSVRQSGTIQVGMNISGGDDHYPLLAYAPPPAPRIPGRCCF